MSTTTTLFGSTEAQAARDLIGGTAIGDLRNDLLKQILVATANRTGGSGSSGTVTSFSFTNGAGISGVVTNPTTTPALALTLGAITPTSVNGLTLVAAATGFTIAGGTTSKTLTVQNTLSLAGVDSSVLTIPATGTAALLGTANVFTAAQTISVAGADSTSPFYLTGALNVAGTGTTTFPQIFHQPIGATAATTWSSGANGGTVFGANEAPGFVGNFADFRRAGARMFTIKGSNGGIRCGSDGAIPLVIDGLYATTSFVQYGDGGLGCSSSLRTNGSLLVDGSGDVWINGTAGSFQQNADTFWHRKAAAVWQAGLDAAGVTNQMLTAASRITSDGVGANLTIAGGNGRGGAGGSLIFSYYTTAAAATIGTLTTALTLDTTGLFTFADAVNLAFNTTTGTKIGTAADQKLSFWGATPIAQPTTSVSGSFFEANSSGIVDDSATWDGYSVGRLVTALRAVGILA